MLLAVLLMGLGIAFLLNNAGWIEMDVSGWIADFWPLIFVYFGLVGLLRPLFKYGIRGIAGVGLLWNSFLIIFGGVWTASNRGLTAFTLGQIWSWFWPVLLIAASLFILLNVNVKFPEKQTMVKFHNSIAGSVRYGDGEDYWELTPLFIRQKMGEVYIDLTRAKIKDGETPIDVELKMGRVEIILPEGLECSVEGSVKSGKISIFGQNVDGIARYHAIKTSQYDESSRKVKVNVEVKLGEISVTRSV